MSSETPTEEPYSWDKKPYPLEVKKDESFETFTARMRELKKDGWFSFLIKQCDPTTYLPVFMLADRLSGQFQYRAYMRLRESLMDINDRSMDLRHLRTQMNDPLYVCVLPAQAAWTRDRTLSCVSVYTYAQLQKALAIKDFKNFMGDGLSSDLSLFYFEDPKVVAFIFGLFGRGFTINWLRDQATEVFYRFNPQNKQSYEHLSLQQYWEAMFKAAGGHPDLTNEDIEIPNSNISLVKRLKKLKAQGGAAEEFVGFVLKSLPNVVLD